MRLPSFRVRTLMLAVVIVALLIGASMIGSRSYDYYRRARMYAEQERGWRSIAARNRPDSAFALECAEYFDGLTQKYRRAMGRPWVRVEPDPWVPGAEAYHQPAHLSPAHHYQNAPTKNEK